MEQSEKTDKFVDSGDLFLAWLGRNRNRLGEAIRELGISITDGPRLFERLRDTITFALMMREQ